MSPNQFQDDEVAMILELEACQRQEAAAREALGEKATPIEPPARRSGRASRPTGRESRPGDADPPRPRGDVD